jgi:hypothetical protein
MLRCLVRSHGGSYRIVDHETHRGVLLLENVSRIYLFSDTHMK